MDKMTRDAASRIQSAACRAGDGMVTVGSFAARAMSAAYRNEPLSAPVSNATGISQGLIKFGLFALAGAAAYYNSDKLLEYLNPVYS